MPIGPNIDVAESPDAPAFEASNADVPAAPASPAEPAVPAVPAAPAEPAAAAADNPPITFLLSKKLTFDFNFKNDREQCKSQRLV